MTHASAGAGPAVFVAAAAAASSATPQAMIPPVIHAISGAIGGSVALLLLYPLERARIELQKSLSHEYSRQQALLGASNEALASKKPIAATAIGDSWSVGSSDSEGVSDDFQDALSEIDEKVPATLTLSQCVRAMWKEKALYRGVTPIVTTLAISNFVFFYVNELMKRLTFHRTVNKSTNRLLASCLAGVCNVLLTNPLWVANLRIVTGESQSSQLLPELIHVVRTNGISHLWSGTGALLLLVSNPVVQFFLYDVIKGSKSRITPIQAFLIGAIAKAIATVLTYPLQVTQTVLRMQQQPPKQVPGGSDGTNHPVLHQYKGMWDCLVKVYGRDGIAGLFTGMRAKLLQTVLTAAFTFLTYEQIVTALFTAHQALKQNHKRR